MLIAVVSDTHSRTKTVERTLALIGERDVAHVIHCGDIEDGEIVNMFPANSHFVLGNCDKHPGEIAGAVESIGGQFHHPFGHLELAGKKIAFLHGDDSRLLRELTQSGLYNYLFHGHTHIAKDEMVGQTRVINPGALHRAKPKTFIFLEVESGKVETVVVEVD